VPGNNVEALIKFKMTKEKIKKLTNSVGIVETMFYNFAGPGMNLSWKAETALGL